ncbi:unnamed protein product [Penicillium roqueforti FM164]|uniref:Genomic scaffold, ProqFM164S01 n=1 Tax=Penicillium roqueforti (strain FM164) TaxID=1365484 RepID=W6QFL4_PENRF|nr:unnamed protein product [Penicillium roqueforti FM164]
MTRIFTVRPRANWFEPEIRPLLRFEWQSALLFSDPLGHFARLPSREPAGLFLFFFSPKGLNA